MDDETQEALRELIENKNYFGVEELIMAQPMDEGLKKVFLKLPELFGSLEQIKLAKTLTTNARALHAIDRLEKVQAILESYGLAGYVSYDLGMLSKYKYYTGIIFKAYTYGTGDYIVTGGRYDKLLVQFGKDTPAVGFAIVIDQLMLALSRQKIHVNIQMVNTMVLYDIGAQTEAVKLAMRFRSIPMPVQLIRKSFGKPVEAYQEFAARRGLHNILYLSGTGEQITFIDADTGKSHKIALAEYLKQDTDTQMGE